jgi:hypothetical protein
MKTRSVILRCVVVLACAAAPASAHHGATGYDLTRMVTSSAIVTSLTWANPHCLVHFDIKDPDGKVTNWSIELYNPVYMTRAGWTKDTLKAGDEITISFHPSKNGTPNGYIRAGDGKIVFRGQELGLVQR